MYAIRSRLLTGMVLVLLLGLGTTGVTAGVEPCYLVTCIRSLQNEYHVAWQKGGQMFADSVGLGSYHVTQLSEGNSQKQLDDIKAMIAKVGSKKNAVFNIDANESAIARPIAEALEEAGLYFVTQWSKPEDLHPKDFKYYLCHMTVNSEKVGYETGKILAEAMGKKGNVVAIQGMLGNSTAWERYEGFKRALAEYPQIKLLASQPADWERGKGMAVMENWLIAYDKIDGVWGANDEMALGAIEALRGAGKAGKIPVIGIDATTEALRAVKSGELVCTVSSNVYWQGGMALSMAYKAWKGEIVPSKLPPEKREFFFKHTVVTKANVDKFLGVVPKYDWDDIWGLYDGPVPIK